MNLIDELEAKIPQLNREDLARFRDWFDQYVESRLELRDEIKAELDQAWSEIGGGSYRARQTPRG
jgi:hypothetical protein